MTAQKRSAKLIILVAALGYFVDIYDLVLFSIVRVPSLKGIGVAEADLLNKGVLLLDMQMLGMLLGGILWGILGDKRGRLSVLFGSICMYSIANIANGFVSNMAGYAALRLLAGVGLAGELGAGITLVSETMPKESRGYGTTIVATIGIMGAVAAALIGDVFPWRTSYFIGGGLGLVLLLLRIGVYESGMYESVKQKKDVERGNFFRLFATKARALRYLSVIFIGVPIWYAVGILITFSPEIGKAMGMSEVPSARWAVMYTYIGLSVGDFSSGALSQVLKNRRKVVLLFLLLTALSIVLYFLVGRASTTAFYVVCTVLGFATGYWAVFVTIASEQFGTNLRATATTTAPNFVRGAVVLLTSLFQGGKALVGVQGSAVAVGVLTMAIAFAALRSLDETYGKDLDFIES